MLVLTRSLLAPVPILTLLAVPVAEGRTTKQPWPPAEGADARPGRYRLEVVVRSDRKPFERSHPVRIR